MKTAPIDPENIVIARVWKSGHRKSRVWTEEYRSILLLFPYQRVDCANPYTIESWDAREGHGSADYQICMMQTRPASRERAEEAVADYEKRHDVKLTLRWRLNPKLWDDANRKWEQEYRKATRNAVPDGN